MLIEGRPIKPSDTEAVDEVRAELDALRKLFVDLVVGDGQPLPRLLFAETQHRDAYTSAFSGVCRRHVENICSVASTFLDVQIEARQVHEFNSQSSDYALRYRLDITPSTWKHDYEPEDADDIAKRVAWFVELGARVGRWLSVTVCVKATHLVTPRVTALLCLDFAECRGGDCGV